MSNVISSICFALSVNLFFRKSFLLRHHGSFFLLLLSFASINKFFDFVAILQVTGFQTFHGLSYSLAEWDSQDILNVVCTCGWYYYYQTMPKFHWYWCSIPFFSLFQLILNPAILRDLLRPIRVGFGPPSILNASLIGWLEIWHQPTIFSIQTLLSVCCLLTAFKGSIVREYGYGGREGGGGVICSIQQRGRRRVI